MLTAAILAGGRARRYGGQDKSALVVDPRDGRTILDRQLRELSLIADEILLVGGRTERAGTTLVADRIAGCGPLGGLHAALTSATHDVVVAIACDMPYVVAPFLAYLGELADPARGPEAVVPQTGRGYHPLCAAYTRAALTQIERRLAAGRLTMTDLLADLRMRVVASDEIARFGDPDRLLANVNTPAEHQSLEALHNHEL